MPLSETLENIITEVQAAPSVRDFLISQNVFTCAHLLDAVNDVSEVEAKIAAKLEPANAAHSDCMSLQGLDANQRGVNNALHQ